MAIDQRLMMGIIFIIAGVALALLAYAAFLYRRSPAELDEGLITPEEAEDEGPDSDDTRVVLRPPTTPEQGVEPADEGIETGDEDETQAGAAVETETASAAPGARDQAGEETPVLEESSGGVEGDREPAGAVPSEDDRAEQELIAPTATTVNLSQSPATGRLVVEIGDRTFSNAQDLRDSDQWKQVGPILRDVVAWLTIADSVQEEAQEPREPGALHEPAPASLSMVEQINLILERKLDRGEISTRAVRLVEGAGGEIRVYIGVNSYAMEEVPDAEVKQLIREAVAEWESQQ